MTKSLGQIARESARQFLPGQSIPYDTLPEPWREEWEAIAQAVANECINALDPDKYPNECDKSMVHNCKLAIRKRGE